MPEQTVLVVAIDADPPSLHQTLSVLKSHRMRHELVYDSRTALESGLARSALLAIVQGSRVGMRLVGAVETLANVTEHRVPILVLADGLTEADEYRVLSAGARDALSTAVSPTRLRMRILAIRRTAVSDTRGARHLVCGSLTVDVGRREAWVAGQSVPLTRSEFNLLVVLARDPRQVVTRQELARCIGKSEASSAVESHLSRLRRKLTAMHTTRVIEPVRGVGYRLGPVVLAQRVS